MKKLLIFAAMLLVLTMPQYIAYADETEETTTSEDTDTTTDDSTSDESSSEEASEEETTDTEDEDTSEEETDILTGWQEIDGYTYYYDEDGNYLTGVNKIDGAYYYFNGNGIMRTGWRTYNSKTYYFSKSSSTYGQAYTGLKKISGKYYYFKKNGVMITGWKKISGNTYFFHTKGSNKGSAAIGLKKISGTIYLFSKTGCLQSYEGDALDKKAVAATSDTKFIVVVSLSAHKVAIYKTIAGGLFRVRTFKCTVGATDTPTVTGTFKMGTTSSKAYKMTYFDAEGGYRCWYATRITGGYLFHSVLYWPTDSPVSSAIANGTLGANLSHGCVRLALSAAKYIYNKIPYGTTCVIY
ncbi:MAG: L,D-transpeptidase family protein [Eubacterium sp.]|nr:L,D-transpeptidase family protein [Eubacterium sp.]